MAKAAEIKTRVTADNRDFKKKMKGSKSVMSNFKKGAIAAGAAIVASFAAIGVSVVRSTMAQQKALDTLAKQARTLNVDLEELTSVELGLQLSGAEGIAPFLKGVKGLATALDQLSRSSTGPAADALDRLGLTVADLSGSPLEAMKKIGDGLRKISDPIQRLATGQALLGGRAITELMPWLIQGSEAITAMGDNARRMGLVLTTEQGKIVEDANDAMLELKKIYVVGFNAIAIGIGPVLEDIAEAIAEAFKGDDVLQDLINEVKWATAQLQSVFRFLTAVNSGSLEDFYKSTTAFLSGGVADMVSKDLADAAADALKKDPTAASTKGDAQSSILGNAIAAALGAVDISAVTSIHGLDAMTDELNALNGTARDAEKNIKIIADDYPLSDDIAPPVPLNGLGAGGPMPFNPRDPFGAFGEFGKPLQNANPFATADDPNAKFDLKKFARDGFKFDMDETNGLEDTNTILEEIREATTIIKDSDFLARAS